MGKNKIVRYIKEAVLIETGIEVCENRGKNANIAPNLIKSRKKVITLLSCKYRFINSKIVYFLIILVSFCSLRL